MRHSPEKALALNTELDRKEGMATNYANLGSLFLSINNIDKALPLLCQAADLFADLGSPNEQMARDLIARHETPTRKQGVSAEWTQ